MRRTMIFALLACVGLLSFAGDNDDGQSLIGESKPGVYVELPQWAKDIRPTEKDIPKLCTNSIDRLTKRTATGLLSIIDAMKERQGKWMSYDIFKYGDYDIPQPGLFDPPVREYFTNMSLRTESVLNDGVHSAFKQTKTLVDCDALFSRYGGYFGSSLILRNDDSKIGTDKLLGYDVAPTNRKEAAKLFLSAVTNGLYATYFDMSWYGDKQKKSAQTPWFANAASFTSSEVSLESDRDNGGAICDISNIVNIVACRTMDEPDETKYRRIAGNLPAVTAAMDASVNICYQPYGFGSFFGSTSNVTSELIGDYKLRKRYEEVKVTDIRYGLPFNRDSTNLTYIKVSLNKEVDESEKEGKYRIFSDVQHWGGDAETILNASVTMDDCTGAAKVIVTSGYSAVSFPTELVDDGMYSCDILYTVHSGNTCDWEYRIYVDEAGGRFVTATTYGTPYVPTKEQFFGGADIWLRSDGARTEIFHTTEEIATTNDDVSAVWKNIPFHFPATRYADCFGSVYLQTGIVYDYSWESEDICEGKVTTTTFRDSDNVAVGIVKECGKKICDQMSERTGMSVEQLEDEKGLQQYTDSKMDQSFQDMKRNVTSEWYPMSLNHEVLAKKIQVKDGHIEAIFDGDGNILQQQDGKWITCAYISIIQDNATAQTNINESVRASVRFSRAILAKPDNLPLEPKSN